MGAHENGARVYGASHVRDVEVRNSSSGHADIREIEVDEMAASPQVARFYRRWAIPDYIPLRLHAVRHEAHYRG